jgi:hypothetical protein
MLFPSPCKLTLTEEAKVLAQSHEKIRAASGALQFLKLEGEPILQLTEGKNEKPKT